VYIFAQCPTNSVIIAPLFSFFIKRGTFLLARGTTTVRVVGWIIVCELSDTFHRLVNILALDVVYETVGVGVQLYICRDIGETCTCSKIRTNRFLKNKLSMYIPT